MMRHKARTRPMMAGQQGKPLSKIELMKLRVYLKNPVAFVQEELKENPSPDQEKLLMDIADMDNKYIILSAGRGAGKTLAVSWIVAWSMAILPAVFGDYKTVILGGSYEQSKVMYQYFKEHIYQTPLLEKKLIGDPTKGETIFTDATARAITASEKSVRGRHIELLILDEVCATDDELVRSALPMVTGSKHGRTIMLSTPHKFYGIFQDYWDNSHVYEYSRHGPWPLTNCAWIDPEWLRLMKEQYTPGRYDVEILGIPAKGGALVFNSEWLDACTAPSPFAMNPNYGHDGGIDWGHTNPTVLVRLQSYAGKLHVPGPPLRWQYEHFPKIQDDIKAEYKTKRGETYYADASHIGENERMEANGIDTMPVIWTDKLKPALAELAQFLVYKKMLRFSPDNVELLKALKKYRWEEQKAGGKEKLTKKEADDVEAFLLSLYSLHESGFMATAYEREAMPAGL